MPKAKPKGKRVTIVRSHPRRVAISPAHPDGITIVDQHPRPFQDFNQKFGVKPPEAPLDPDLIKALIGSESRFLLAPRNPKAIGIAQITPSTLKALLDSEGEVKEFVFKGVRQKDLKDPEIAIPMGIRWIFRKKRLAAGKLGRAPTADEIILEYKGLLKAQSKYKRKALENFQKKYARLKKK